MRREALLCRHGMTEQDAFGIIGTMQKLLVIAGIVLIAAGLLWPVLSKLGIGRLPGDILIRRDGFTFYFPLTTMIIASVVLTLIFRLWGGGK